MRVLLLSVTAGFGHHATAKAVSDQFKACGAVVETIDVYEVINRFIKEAIDKGYLFSSKHTKELYRLFYSLAENSGQSYWSGAFQPINLINDLGAKKFARCIEDFEPDVIICTHIFAAQLVDELKRRELVSVPCYGICTDYTLHPFWEDVPRIEYVVIASELLTHRCVQRGVGRDRLLPLGIPVHPKFNVPLSREDAAAALGIDPSRPTILLMGGSMGYANHQKTLEALSEIGKDFQFLVVCGNNKKSQSQLGHFAEEYTGRCTICVYGFVDNVDVMMSASDCIITKPGGLTVSEALARHLPMLLVDPIPGHEERNVEFLLNNGMAMAVTKTFPVDEAVYNLFTNPGRIENIRKVMALVAHPDATEKLVAHVLSHGTPERETFIPEMPAE
ncbi:glycosyltransferase [Clostridiaceae bacterium]|nr:glycosyltransferase [Clostridiaceae bacterium]